MEQGHYADSLKEITGKNITRQTDDPLHHVSTSNINKWTYGRDKKRRTTAGYTQKRIADDKPW